jgi:hypothetical protein
MERGRGLHDEVIGRTKRAARRFVIAHSAFARPHGKEFNARYIKKLDRASAKPQKTRLTWTGRV